MSLLQKSMQLDVSIRNRVVVPLITPINNIITDPEIISFNNLCDRAEHIAICFAGWKQQEIPLIRLHSECLTGDVFLSMRCDCGNQLKEAINRLQSVGGIILYLRQEGRGIGLYNKIDAYSLQDKGCDTFEANNKLNFSDDLRDYKSASEMLKALGITKIRLLTNNADKAQQLIKYGIEVVECVATGTYVNKHNISYLKSKVAKQAHTLQVKTGN